MIHSTSIDFDPDCPCDFCAATRVRLHEKHIGPVTPAQPADDITPEELSRIEADHCSCLRCAGNGSYLPMYHAEELGKVPCGMCSGTGRIENATSRLVAALRRRDREIEVLRNDVHLRQATEKALTKIAKQRDALAAEITKLHALRVDDGKTCGEFARERDAAKALLARAAEALRLFRGPYGLPERGELTAACKAADTLLAEIEAEQ